MKMLVLGGGLQGSACAFDLLRSKAVEAVTIADIAPEKLPSWLPTQDPRLKAVKLDARDEAAALALMKGHDAVMSALPSTSTARWPGSRLKRAATFPTSAATPKS
jgi:lysine 6-dehydrogenase